MNTTGSPNPADHYTSIEARARRRVGIKLGFYVHTLVFVLVNLGLYVMSSAFDGGFASKRWAHFPLWGWGLGLAIHGVGTYMSLQGDGMRSRMVAREIERLKREPR